MEEKEEQEIATEGFSYDAGTSDDLTLEETQVSESEVTRSIARLDQKQKIILKALTAFLLLAIGVLLGGIFIWNQLLNI